MKTLDFRAPLGAMLLLALVATPTFAGKAVTSADMTLREGPGDSYRTLLTIAAGSTVDLRECDREQWCRVIHHDVTGWVHVKRIDKPRGGGGGGVGTPGASGGSDTAMTGGDPGGPGGKKGGSRTRPDTGGKSGEETISAIDGASLPGSSGGPDTSGRGRAAAMSDSSSGSGGGSGEPAANEAQLATASPCMRC